MNTPTNNKTTQKPSDNKQIKDLNPDESTPFQAQSLDMEMHQPQRSSRRITIKKVLRVMLIMLGVTFVLSLAKILTDSRDNKISSTSDSSLQDGLKYEYIAPSENNPTCLSESFNQGVFVGDVAEIGADSFGPVENEEVAEKLWKEISKAFPKACKMQVRISVTGASENYMPIVDQKGDCFLKHLPKERHDLSSETYKTCYNKYQEQGRIAEKDTCVYLSEDVLNISVHYNPNLPRDYFDKQVKTVLNKIPSFVAKTCNNERTR